MRPLEGNAIDMKIAMPAAGAARLPIWPRLTAKMLYRLAGLLIAVCVPTTFWTFALVLTTKGTGVSLEPPALFSFSCVVAAWCLVVAMLVTDPKSRDPRVLVSSSVRR